MIDSNQPSTTDKQTHSKAPSSDKTTVIQLPLGKENSGNNQNTPSSTDSSDSATLSNSKPQLLGPIENSNPSSVLIQPRESDDDVTTDDQSPGYSARFLFPYGPYSKRMR